MSDCVIFKCPHDIPIERTEVISYQIDIRVKMGVLKLEVGLELLDRSSEFSEGIVNEVILPVYI